MIGRASSRETVLELLARGRPVAEVMNATTWPRRNIEKLATENGWLIDRARDVACVPGQDTLPGPVEHPKRATAEQGQAPADGGGRGALSGPSPSDPRPATPGTGGRGEDDEYDARVRALEAERLRPVPPAPSPAPSALSRYQALIELAAQVPEDLTVETFFATADRGGEGR